MTSSLHPDPKQVPSPGRDELAAWLRLALTPGVGPATALKLLQAFGAPASIFAANHSKLTGLVGQALATRLLRADPEHDARIGHSLAWASEPGHHLLTLADSAYPQALLNIPDPPALLYVKGQPEALQRPAIAMVGSRHATLGGNQTARAFAASLTTEGLLVISGLARGIDTAAHLGALDAGGLTLAVLGTGIDRIYPSGNRELANRIAAQGALITEFPPGTGPGRSNFPRRNRIIAGLAGGVLVVEAARRSGSLITARQGADFGRDVFAIPGSIHSPLARGCHQLIRDGARLVESADDILSELRPDFLMRARQNKPGSAAHQICLSGNHTTDPTIPELSGRLLEAMGWDSVSYDSLSMSGIVSVKELPTLLLELELSGHLERLADGRFRRLSA